MLLKTGDSATSTLAGPTLPVRLLVNGQFHDLHLDPRTSLLDAMACGDIPMDGELREIAPSGEGAFPQALAPQSLPHTDSPPKGMQGLAPPFLDAVASSEKARMHAAHDALEIMQPPDPASAAAAAGGLPPYEMRSVADLDMASDIQGPAHLQSLHQQPNLACADPCNAPAQPVAAAESGHNGKSSENPLQDAAKALPPDRAASQSLPLPTSNTAADPAALSPLLIPLSQSPLTPESTVPLFRAPSPPPSHLSRIGGEGEKFS